MRAISRLNVNDTSGFAYGPRPTFESLISMYSFLFHGWGNLHLFAGLGMNGLIVLCAMCLIGVTRFFLFAFRKPPLSGGARPVGAKTHQSDFWRIVVGVVVFPLIVFLFALAVTKTFNLLRSRRITRRECTSSRDSGRIPGVPSPHARDSLDRSNSYCCVRRSGNGALRSLPGL